MGDDRMCQVSPQHSAIWNLTLITRCSCAIHPHSKQGVDEARWKQIWQLAVRSLSISSTSRAACVLLRAILKTQLLPLHTVADDISNIVTMADICGPAVLVDSSLVLMHYLANTRNELVPSAIQKTSSNVIRWVFSNWKPGNLHSIRLSTSPRRFSRPPC